MVNRKTKDRQAIKHESSSCMRTVHHDHIQMNQLRIKTCILNPNGRFGLKANDESEDGRQASHQT